MGRKPASRGARYINITPIQLRNALKKDAQDTQINGYKFSKLTKDAANSKLEPNNVGIPTGPTGPWAGLRPGGENPDTKEITVYSSITSAKAMGSNQSCLSGYLIRNSSTPFKINYLIRRLS